MSEESLMKANTDHEEDTMVPTSQWQKAVWLHQYLPYYNQMEAEADEQLRVIKAGLAQSIVLREVRPALLHWISELDKYINLYSRRFSKTDHVAIAQLIYECMVMEGLEYRTVMICANTLSTLLKKKVLLSRNDLTLPWRPLYDIYVDVAYKRPMSTGLLWLPADLEKSLETVIGHVRVYFPLEATQEILDEVRPYICPFVNKSFRRATTMLKLFLPTSLSHEEHEKSGAKLWFDELWHWFTSVEISAPWEAEFILIFARLTVDSPGYINWSDKYDFICTHLLRAFDLYIGQEQISAGSFGPGEYTAESFDAFAIWLCYMLGGPNDGIQGHLTRLIRSLESYFHPSNYGYDAEKLLKWVLKLVESVCARLKKERHEKPTCHLLVPPSMRLTNQQVDMFVESLLPIASLIIFSKHEEEQDSEEARSVTPDIIRFLCQLAPRLVVPAVLDIVYPSLETLTEPHRLLQSMNCLVAVCVSLARDNDNDSSHKRRPLEYADDQSGRPCRSHVISLLNGILPGLDANDIDKTLLTLQTINLFCELVPIVDCSEAVHVREDLTEEERELCSATANFESIVEDLMTRLFALVESFAPGHSMTAVQSLLVVNTQGFSMEDYQLKRSITDAFHALISNCSSAIFKVVVDRLFDYVSENSFDSRNAANILAQMIGSVIQINPTESFPRFLNLNMTRLRAVLTENTHKEEEVDSSVIWYLILASQLVNVSGTQIVRFRTEILELLSLVMPLKCRKAHDIAVSMLETVLTVLTMHYLDMLDFKRCRLEEPFEKFLPFRHWAETLDRKSWEPKWHVPSEEELSLVDELFRLFLTPELDRLSRPNEMTKEEVLKSLVTIDAFIGGSSALLPPFESDPIALSDSTVDVSFFNYTIAESTIRNLVLGNGEHVRQKVFDTVHGLTDFILKHREDDTKSLVVICNIYDMLTFHRGVYKWGYDTDLSDFMKSKKIKGDVVRGREADIESITKTRIMLEHRKRSVMRFSGCFTKAHLDIMRDLVCISTCTYSKVRGDAQELLRSFVQTIPYSYKLILDDVLLLLKEDSTISHEQLKGALYILWNAGMLEMCAQQSWDSLLKTLPVVVAAQHSEKPSIIDLFEKIRTALNAGLESFQIRFRFSDSCVQLAKKSFSLSSDNHPFKCPIPTAVDEQNAIEREARRSDDNEKLYYTLMDKLTALSNDSSLHWRRSSMAQLLLKLLIRRDMSVPDNVVRLFFRLFAHDSSETRVAAKRSLTSWLKIVKPVAVKVQLDLPVKLPNRSVGAKWPIQYGFMADNRFLQYEQASLPKNAKEWDDMVFVDKRHLGFYTWPKELLVNAPASSQKAANRTKSELTPVELFIVEQLNDVELIDKLVGFMALDEESSYNYLLRALFRNLNDIIVPAFRRPLEKLVRSEKKGEQQVAADIVDGLIGGSRLWSYDKLTTLWAWLQPLLTSALENVPTEAVETWTDTLALTGDSRRNHWLLDVLFGLCEKPTDSSFHATTRFKFIVNALNYNWRALEMYHRLTDLCRPILVQPYQNLRDQLGRCITTIVDFNIHGICVDESAVSPRFRPPSLNGIIDEMASPNGKMKVLWSKVIAVDLHEKDSIKTLVDSVNEMKVAAGDVTGSNGPLDKERKEALLLLKTLLRYLDRHWREGMISLPDSIIRLLPLLTYFENETCDEELYSDARCQLRLSMSHTLVSDLTAGKLLIACHEIIVSSRWWKAKVSTLKYIQVVVFSNLFTFLRADRVSQVRRLIFATIADQRLEVREAAAESLSGFIHCAYFDVDAEMTNEFCSWALSEEGSRRHAGVLALAAIVQAFPYTVPDFLPFVLMKLCYHATDKQPMQGTVKKALSEFKRTHQDCWHEHKKRFSEDQLAVLTDLLVSPNYYI